MNSIKKCAKKIYRVYVAVGIATVGLMAFLVVFTVVMRYCFNISFAFLEEFTTVTFAFTTFWGAGICILENENINIDLLYVKLRGAPKKVVALINTVLILLINVIMLVCSIYWVVQVGGHVSMGMRIPMLFIYGIMPVCMVIAIICTLIYLAVVISRPSQEFVEGNLPQIDLKA